jgi:mannosyltransferase OCH1-like enzyme
MTNNIIHHIGPSDENKWHPLWKQCQESLIDNFKDYDYKFWNDENDIDNFVKNSFNDYYEMYKNLTKISKINFSRYCIIEKYGGIYCDLDVYCYKNFSNFIDNKKTFLLNETYEFSNDFYYFDYHHITDFTKNKSFWNKVLQEIKQRSKYININNNNRMEETTGTDVLQCIMNNSFNNFLSDNIIFLPANIFNNLTGSYHKNFYTKHIRTSSWLSNFYDKMLIVEGMIINEKITDEFIVFLEKNNFNFYILNYDEFDFYKDYSNGNYLKVSNHYELRNRIRYIKSAIYNFLSNSYEKSISYS